MLNADIYTCSTWIVIRPALTHDMDGFSCLAPKD